LNRVSDKEQAYQQQIRNLMNDLEQVKEDKQNEASRKTLIHDYFLDNEDKGKRPEEVYASSLA